MIQFDTLSLSTDEDSFCWTLSASTRDMATWDMIRARSGTTQETEITLNGHVFHVIFDGVERSMTLDDCRYKITGRSKTALLSAPYAEPLTRKWTGQRATDIAGALCTAAGITLDWQTIDYTPRGGVFAVDKKRPVEIIRELIDPIDAVMATSLDGSTLKVRPRYPVDPVTADMVLDTAVSMQETWEWREGYNAVEIMDSSSSVMDGKPDASAIGITLEHVLMGGNSARVDVTVNPYRPVILLTPNLDGELYPSGETIETLTESVSIRNGRGQLQYEPRTVVSHAWAAGCIHESSPTIAIDGAVVTTNNATMGTLIVVYTVTVQHWMAHKPDGKPMTVYVEI